MSRLQSLQRDHRQVSSLLQRIRAQFGQERSSPLDLFLELKRVLETHARVEELHVYPVFQQSEVTRDNAAQALEDHRQIKTLLEALEGKAVDFQWVQKFDDLAAVTERHMRMEEVELFDESDNVMTPAEAEELEALVETAKKEVHGEASLPAGGIPD